MKTTILKELAEQARSDGEAILYSYPIRRKGEPRRLNPNWAAVEYLELQSSADFELIETYGHGDELDGVVFDGGTVREFTVQRYGGWRGAKYRRMYPRPIFEVFTVGASSSMQVREHRPCPHCDDWSRTARCEEHHDRDGIEGLRLYEQRRMSRALTERRAHYSPLTSYRERPRNVAAPTLDITEQSVQGIETVQIEVEFDAFF